MEYQSAYDIGFQDFEKSGKYIPENSRYVECEKQALDSWANAFFIVILKNTGYGFTQGDQNV